MAYVHQYAKRIAHTFHNKIITSSSGTKLSSYESFIIIIWPKRIMLLLLIDSKNGHNYTAILNIIISAEKNWQQTLPIAGVEH